MAKQRHRAEHEPAERSPLHIIIGLKRLALAKQRLVPHLSLEQRRTLMLDMLAIVVREARSAALGPVSLATSEPTAPEIAEQLGVTAVSDGDLPWNQGLVHALDQLRPRPAAVLYLAGDLPLVTANDLHALVAAAPERGVVIARARDGGSNALLVRPPELMQPMFGRFGSAAVHAARAAELNVPGVTLDVAALALDVDTIVDAQDAGLVPRHVAVATAEAGRPVR